MLIRLIRNQPKGSAITGRLVINGRFFCNTLERVGYQIPALCYPVRVTQSPKFRRLLPLVCGVPSSVESCRIVEDSVESSSAEKTMLNHSTQPLHKATPCAMRSGIRFHRGTKPQHSTGCILVVADNRRSVESCRMVQSGVESCSGGVELCRMVQNGVESSFQEQLLNNATQPLNHSTPPQGRTPADVEQELTRLILKAQKEHEEIILEVTDFRPGTEYGYNTQCPPELQKP